MKKNVLLLAIMIALIVWMAWPARGADIAPLSQYGLQLNSEVNGAANTAVTTTLTGVTNRSVRLYSIAVRCSTTSFASVSVQNGVSGPIWFSGDASFTSANTKTVAWIPPLTFPPGGTAVITLGACGLGLAGGVLGVQADQY